MFQDERSRPHLLGGETVRVALDLNAGFELAEGFDPHADTTDRVDLAAVNSDVRFGH